MDLLDALYVVVASMDGSLAFRGDSHAKELELARNLVAEHVLSVLKNDNSVYSSMTTSGIAKGMQMARQIIERPDDEWERRMPAFVKEIRDLQAVLEPRRTKNGPE